MAARLSIFLVISCLLSACGSGSDFPSLPGLPPSTGGGGTGNTGLAAELGDAARELAYFQSQGDGAIQTIQDRSAPGVGVATIVNGQRVIIMNPVILAGFPASVRDHVFTHEVGHHYMNHTATPPTMRTEHLADAYCARIMVQLEGVEATRAMISGVRRGGAPADATHASSEDRAAYMTRVLDAWQTDPSRVPEPPAGSATGLGTLVIRNPVNEPGFIFINGQFAGQLGVGGTLRVPVAAGSYRIDLQGALSGTIYSPAFVVVARGQTVFV